MRLGGFSFATALLFRGDAPKTSAIETESQLGSVRKPDNRGRKTGPNAVGRKPGPETAANATVDVFLGSGPWACVY